MRNGYIPVIRRTQLADGSILDKIVGKINKKTTAIELPQVEITFSDESTQTLYITAGILAGGLVLSKFL